ncbi:NAD-dependent epimerase/dehydratase family protein [Sphingobacterium spiritivorum]|uniref:NAD-dependent epimerase/dehydratase family protein n=1 Tax=Sphingobacterium spiritivorum TaxID=258 RepID=UPI00191A345D|nr:NAD-dependent epimerase/dehydratase family protein [Sphingobacterium spiritivorum]QQT27570.1 NAD-dependent epimerase/dehydratase family protein [Sphingobacterium spiritivorum]
MDKTGYTALVLGSTGLIGSFLVEMLLDNTQYSTVYAVSRSQLQMQHPKLINIIADADSIAHQLENIAVDHLYCCLGSTKSKTPDLSAYYKIDHDYPLSVAQHLKDKGLSAVSLVSSMGANVLSNNFYLKMKGEIERDIELLSIKRTFIFRPSLLLGKRKENRMLEKVSSAVMNIINYFLIGKLKDYKSIKGEDVARSMMNICLSDLIGTHIIKTAKIKELA